MGVAVVTPDEDVSTRNDQPLIEFVNHASVLISYAGLGLLCDPWYFGRVFHEGWSLLVELDDATIRDLLARTDVIWLSHEHPDHFSPPFFKRYAELIRQRGIRFLFQATRDQRVVAFLREQGFVVQAMAEAEWIELAPQFSVRMVKDDLYDSALLVEVDGVRVFNLNDCLLNTDQALTTFRQRYGTCDVLLTQFSYAAWKGGRQDRAWRERAARLKLEVMRRQLTYLQPAVCIPFASFVRFSHQLNAYMNDAVNQPAAVLSALQDMPTQLVVMRPGEVQPLRDMLPQRSSLQYWQQCYAELPDLALADYPAMPSLEPLSAAFVHYQQWVFKKNHRWLMRLAQRWLKLRPFGSCRVWLQDLATTVDIDPLYGRMEVVANPSADVAMHSRSLEFIFRHPFGFDTLFVNGCFEVCQPGGFERFAKCFVIGQLNAAGIYVGPLMMRHRTVLKLLLKKLGSVSSNTLKDVKTS